MEYERLLPHIDRLELWVGNAVMTQEEIGALRATGAAVSVFSAQKFRRSLNAQLRTIIKTCGHFPTDDAAIKLLWLALRNIAVKWGSATHHWTKATQQFAVLYEERFTRPRIDSQQAG